MTRTVARRLSCAGRRIESASAGRKCYLVPCALAAFTPAITQLGYLLVPNGYGGLSLMQWFHGLVFLVMIYLLPAVYAPYGDVRRVRRLMVLFGSGFTLIAFKTALAGSATSDSINYDLVQCFKYSSWALAWLFISVSVRTRRQASILLICILVGSSVDAAFKLVGFCTGKWTVSAYAHEGVAANFGAEGVSGKATVAFLISSVFLAWYQLRRRPWVGALVSVFFLSAVVVTYDRAAQIAFCVSALWCVVWILFVSPLRNRFAVVLRLAVLGVTLGMGYAAIYGLDQITARWKYEFRKTGTISGSGRTVLYGATWDWMTSATTAEFLLGQGVSGTVQMLQSATGARVHAHSDLFDMMSIGGMLGLFLYGYLIWVTLCILRSIPRFSAEFLVAIAICISFLFMSLITGQLTAVHAMFTVGASLWCLRLSVMKDYGRPNGGHLSQESCTMNAI
jgi:hypothetical protein